MASVSAKTARLFKVDGSKASLRIKLSVLQQHGVGFFKTRWMIQGKKTDRISGERWDFNVILNDVTFEPCASQGAFGGLGRRPVYVHTPPSHQSERLRHSNAASVSGCHPERLSGAVKRWVVLSDASFLLLEHQRTLKRCSHDSAWVRDFSPCSRWSNVNNQQLLLMGPFFRCWRFLDFFFNPRLQNKSHHEAQPKKKKK